ncbi:hypothetical protein DYBT9623_00823 [Dyadobacter sp. CECT 9623]|uniref:Uncharacterized protein n=1 Tax=Dyadobacter linearis TaxID=2823330 RepID=A0ABM8UKT6_9BACT|nr:hypothetical protein [Dyadobacter sp. CECT 9623]CAG5068095.1 hypothetical protein DYBT9623_00823 [Dyadobacter sp. CECT 9623]
MNLDDLKTSWNTIDAKLQTTQLLSEQVVLSMIRNQSNSTVSRATRKLRNTTLFFSGLLVLFLAILSGNPFDYTHWFEYIPTVLYALLIIAGLQIVISANKEIGGVPLVKSNLRESLQTVILIQQRYQVTMNKVWKISLAAGFLIGISLLVRNFEGYGLTKSLLVIAANALTVLVMFGIARYIFSQFPDRTISDLQMHLTELDELGQ